MKILLIELELLKLIYSEKTAKRIFYTWLLIRVLLAIALGVYYAYSGS